MHAALGGGDWTDVCAQIVDFFPGSYAALLNQSHVRKEFDFNVSAGIDKEHLQSFLQYYAFVNPWTRFWKGARSGAVLVAERDDPARQYQHTEFYNDWMRKVGDYDAAVGLRLSVDDDHVLYLPVHYSVNQSKDYDLALEQLMSALRPSLQNALNLAKLVRGCSEDNASLAALLGTEQFITLVVDATLKPFNANLKAENALKAGVPVRMRGGRIQFAEITAHREIADLLNRDGANPAGFSKRLACSLEHGQWTVSLDRIPVRMGIGLVQSRPLFLLRIEDGRDFNRSFDPQLVQDMFSLSPRELMLSQALAKGAPLVDAAKENGISYEHARQVLKSIFRRTGVGSQAELRLLLTRF